MSDDADLIPLALRFPREGASWRWRWCLLAVVESRVAFEAEIAVLGPDSDREDEADQLTLVRFGDLEFRVRPGSWNDHTADEGVNHSSRPLLRLLRGRQIALTGQYLCSVFQLLTFHSIAARAGRWTERELLLFLQQPDMDDVMASLLRPDGEQVVTREFNRRLRQNEPKDPNRFPKVPSEEGVKLMYSGAFGANDHERHPNKHLARRLLERELGLGSWQERKLNNDLLTQSLIPNTAADQIIHYSEPVYSGQFSDDGNFFYSCCQDFKVRLYDTSNPYNWKHYKTVTYPWGQWTLTDASLSPDNKWLAYTSHSNLVSIAPTDPRDEGDPYSLDLGDTTGLGPGQLGYARDFSSIFSIRFSGNGRELVAGTNRDSLVVYDIESRRVLLNVRGHEDDVNAVCFADKQSPHIIYSGSDDTTIKVWDRRSMRHEREVGAFVGHIEGLTYIDSKGDGRYVLSNGKDQSMKLWDIRMAMSTDSLRELQPTRHLRRRRRFDYRMSRYNEDHWDPHPDDNSVVTFRGHKVLYTLIRCHFSPPSATNSRYVYSGSQDGKVHIWNMDATKAGEIDVRDATRGTRPRDNRQRFYSLTPGGDWNTCVRDASWHPHAPFIAGKTASFSDSDIYTTSSYLLVIVASALNGFSMSNGTVSLHSYGDNDYDDGEPPMPRIFTEDLKTPAWQRMDTERMSSEALE